MYLALRFALRVRALAAAFDAFVAPACLAALPIDRLVCQEYHPAQQQVAFASSRRGGFRDSTL